MSGVSLYFPCDKRFSLLIHFEAGNAMGSLRIEVWVGQSPAPVAQVMEDPKNGWFMMADPINIDDLVR